MDYSLSDIRKQIGVRFEFLHKPFDQDELMQMVLSSADVWLKNRELIRLHGTG